MASSNQKGNAAVLLFASKLSERGVMVFQRFHIPTRSVNPHSKSEKIKRYSSADVDFLVGVILETNDFYCFPIEVLQGIRCGIQVDPCGFSKTPFHHKKLDPELYRNRIVLGGEQVSLK